jgi:hypothetical protein
MTVPTGIAGDPVAGIGNLAWNILLHNVSNACCSLSGWPSLTVATATRLVAITSEDVSVSKLARSAPQRVTLAPRQQAVATIQASDGNAGYRARWRLTLRLPGSAGALTASQPADYFGPCGGGLLRLSPFYPRGALTTAIRDLHVAHSPSPHRTTGARTPGACTGPRLQVAASYGSADHGGSVEVLRVVNRGDECLRAGGWLADHHAT